VLKLSVHKKARKYVTNEIVRNLKLFAAKNFLYVKYNTLKKNFFKKIIKSNIFTNNKNIYVIQT